MMVTPDEATSEGEPLTLEMLGFGVAAYRLMTNDGASDEDLVREIYVAMRAARNLPPMIKRRVRQKEKI
jgi:hypothetical protein